MKILEFKASDVPFSATTSRVIFNISCITHVSCSIDSIGDASYIIRIHTNASCGSYSYYFKTKEEAEAIYNRYIELCKD